MAIVKCQHCGKENDPEREGWGYCVNCGKSLEGATAGVECQGTPNRLGTSGGEETAQGDSARPPASTEPRISAAGSKCECGSTDDVRYSPDIMTVYTGPGAFQSPQVTQTPRLPLSAVSRDSEGGAEVARAAATVGYRSGLCNCSAALGCLRRPWQPVPRSTHVGGSGPVRSGSCSEDA